MQGQLIGRLLETREGVLVAPEGQAQRLEEGHQGAGREIGRAVEGHVLEVVRDAAGAVGLIERARRDVKPDANATCGVTVLPDDIGEAVIERARDERRVGRQRLGGSRRAPYADQRYREREYEPCPDNPHTGNGRSVRELGQAKS
ncbi:MAG: hypothetical protein AABZ69_05140 [Candidatus Binatota bacterium]